MSNHDYDVIVIGAGIAGMVSAVTLRAVGKRVAVIEKTKVGGNCSNTTCIPSKALIRLSHSNRDRKHLSRLGLFQPSVEGLVGPRVMPHIRDIVQRAYEKDRPETFEEIGIAMIAGTAVFIDGNSIEVEGRRFSARNFIIAAGTQPSVPDIQGIEDVDYLTNESLYGLDDLPESLVILGGGVDGLEYASAFSGLGVRVTVVERAEGLLPMADREVVDRLLSFLEAEGIVMITGATAESVRRTDTGISLKVRNSDGSPREIKAERILVAVGRKPDIEGLALENAGVRWNARGIPTDRKMRTSVPHIYACGDVTGPYQLASTAETQAIVAATNAVSPFKRRVDYDSMVSVIFTEPPLAFIGLTEDQARKRFGRAIRVYRSDYADMRRAMIDLCEAGISKIICDRRGRVLGAHILGEAAGEVIHEIQLLVSLKKPLHRLNTVAHAYPTYAQALIGRAGQLAFLDRLAGTIFVRMALAAMPGFSNSLHVARQRLAEEKRAEKIFATGPHEVILGADRWITTHDHARKGEPEKKLSITESESVDGTSRVLHLRGSLDGASEVVLLKDFRKAGENFRQVIFNLSGLETMDTEGAGALVVCSSLAAQKNIDFAACCLPDAFRDLFRLTRLDEAMVIYDDEEAALRGLKAGLPGTPLSAAPETERGPFLPGWARPVQGLSIDDIPAGAMNINVRDRKTTGPVKGFGSLWDKKYRFRIEGTGPEPREIISLWRSEFPRFWPPGNDFFPSGGSSIRPGAVALLNLSLPGGLIVATGLMVIHVDEQSFSFITIQGHMLSGWITFSSFREQGSTIIQIHPLFRAGDPLMELVMRHGGADQEDRFWRDTILTLAERLGVRGELSQRDVLINASFNWTESKNILKSAAIGSTLYMPIHVIRSVTGIIVGR